MTLVSVRRNHPRHLRERGATAPDRPDFYVKGPCRVLAPGDPIPHVAGLIFEGELALVLGHSPAAPGLAITGYAAANDLIVRNLGSWKQSSAERSMAPRDLHAPGPTDPRAGDWAVGLGPAVSLASVDSLALEVTVNGILRACGSVAELVFPPAGLLSAIEAEVRLAPGDVILCGCIGGAGYLSPGDVVAVSLGSVSRVENRVGARA